MPSLYWIVRKELRGAIRRCGRSPLILDVGGRKSHYTIGLPASITISDLPRNSELQRRLHLGTTAEINEQTGRRRSNIREVIFDDMTRTALPSDSFDIAVAVEVLEHVQEDRLFVRNVLRVLKPGGCFIMTTPNGDFVPNNNPDHKRHYRREQLRGLLEAEFPHAEVWYGIHGGVFHRWGLKSWSLKHPIRTWLSMAGNVLNRIQSSRDAVAQKASGTIHLFARCHKAG
jgi:SAM-dependent methyltransferase